MSGVCKHHEEYGENVVLPIAVSLEHFDECFSPQRRLVAWTRMREWQEAASRCFIADHDGAVHELRACYLRIAELSHLLELSPQRRARWTAYHARRRTRRNR